MIYTKLKNIVKDLPREDKLRTLIFDEMSLSPQVHYRAASDQLLKEFACHALVFMVKGIKKKYTANRQSHIILLIVTFSIIFYT